MHVVFLVPHADDEVLLGGGTISKHKRCNDTVSVCTLEEGTTDRTICQNNDIYEAAKILKIDNIHCLNLDEDTISNKLDILAKKIEEYLSSQKIDILYTVSPADNHQDHRALIKAVNIATRVIGPCPIPVIRCGETISSTDQTFKCLAAFTPNYYNILTKDDLQNKINALKCYKKEFKSQPHPRSTEILKAYAEIRGSECGSMYAEAFMQMRKISF